MADDLQYGSNKRKFDDQGATPPPPTLRATVFSAPLTSPPPETSASAAPPQATYNSAPQLVDGIELAKQRAQAIAAKLFSSAVASRSNADNGNDLGGSDDHSLNSLGQSAMSHVGMTPPSSIPTYGNQGPSKKIEIPNGRVGVIIGKSGETIKYLQSQSGAKIQVTRDTDADPYSQTKIVELVGNFEQINKAEQLISEVLSETDAGGSGGLSTRKVGYMPIRGDKFVMKVPNNKVGLIIGKGGETIKNMTAKSGARIQEKEAGCEADEPPLVDDYEEWYDRNRETELIDQEEGQIEDDSDDKLDHDHGDDEKSEESESEGEESDSETDSDADEEQEGEEADAEAEEVLPPNGGGLQEGDPPLVAEEIELVVEEFEEFENEEKELVIEELEEFENEEKELLDEEGAIEDSDEEPDSETVEVLPWLQSSPKKKKKSL